MTATLYRYRFSPHVPLEEVEASLVLALFALESLHGESQVRLDARHALDPARRTCVLDAATAAGRDLNRLFAGFLHREFADHAVRIERILATPAEPASA